MKVAQSMMVKKQLVAEKGLKEKMIHSVMPPKVAEWLMRGHVEDNDEGTSTMFPGKAMFIWNRCVAWLWREMSTFQSGVMQCKSAAMAISSLEI